MPNVWGDILANPSGDLLPGVFVHTALGVNPFLTLSALSERIADHIILRLKELES